MTSLYRAMNDAIFEANLNKNQLLVAHAIMNQTLGYGKTSDPLTDRRLVAITGIRLDRLRPAINAVVKKRLFDRKAHKRFGHEYSIGESFLEAHQGEVYTPAIPKKGSASEKENPISRNDENLTETGTISSEKATHTITNPTSSNQQPLQTKQTDTNTNTEKQTFSNPQQQPQTQKEPLTAPQQEQSSVKLCFSELTQIPHSFAIETSANTRIEFSIGNDDANGIAKVSNDPPNLAPTTIDNDNVIMESFFDAKFDANTNIDEHYEDYYKAYDEDEEDDNKHDDNHDDNTAIPIAESPAITTSDTIDRLKKVFALTKSATSAMNDEEQNEADAEEEREAEIEVDANNQAQQVTTPVCGGGKNEIETTVASIPLPKSINKENHPACNRHFDTLSDEQKKKVVLVFNYEVKKGSVKSIIGYFIHLTRAVKNDTLTIPCEAIVNEPPSPEKLAVQKEQQHRQDLWSQFIWLKENAERENKDLHYFAKDSGMEEAYEMYYDQSKQ